MFERALSLILNTYLYIYVFEKLHFHFIRFVVIATSTLEIQLGGVQFDDLVLDIC